MSGIEAFFMERAERIENEFAIISTRFKDPETGEHMKWEIRPLTESEVSAIRRRCKTKIKGKNGQYTEETDGEAVALKMSVAAVVFPNLKDATLQDSYGVRGEEALLSTMLKSGEYGELLRKVQEISGYDQDINEIVDDAKN